MQVDHGGHGRSQPAAKVAAIWCLAGTTALRLSACGSTGWWTEMKLRRAIRLGSRQGGIVHLLARADELLDHRRYSSLLERLLQNVADRAQKDSLKCLTLQQLSRHIQQRPARVMSQSLLGRAA